MFNIFKRKKPVQPVTVPRGRPYWSTERSKNEVIIDFDLFDVFSIMRRNDKEAEIGWFDEKGKTHEWIVVVDDQSYTKLIDDYHTWKKLNSL